MTNLDNLSKNELLSLAESLKVLDDKKKYSLQDFVYPIYLKCPGYRKHIAFFDAGSHYKERALIAANRTGKTYSAMAEVSYHLNGKYPKEWKGRRFNNPITAWVAGKTHETTRDTLQKYLVGNRFDIGTGFIPKDDIVKINAKGGTADAILDVYVKHYTNGIEDGISVVRFKSYVQGVEAFMADAVHVIHLDEEPPQYEIYSECLMRTMTTEGIIMCTFTPTLGLSNVVLQFLPNGKFPPGGIGEVSHAN